MNLCPCNANRTYDKCCKPYHEGKAQAKTPEILMRSRYSAYALHDFDYIGSTMIGPAKKKFCLQDAIKNSSQMKWLWLDVIAAEHEEKQRGFVEFKAFYIQRGQRGSFHEKSEFHKIDETWYYFDGTILSNNNDLKDLMDLSP